MFGVKMIGVEKIARDQRPLAIAADRRFTAVATAGLEKPIAAMAG